MRIRKLAFNEEPPMDLLLSADPSQMLVEAYLRRSMCYVAELDDQVIATVTGMRPELRSFFRFKNSKEAGTIVLISVTY